jgi:hypothetical protein
MGLAPISVHVKPMAFLFLTLFTEARDYVYGVPTPKLRQGKRCLL